MPYIKPVSPPGLRKGTTDGPPPPIKILHPPPEFPLDTHFTGISLGEDCSILVRNIHDICVWLKIYQNGIFVEVTPVVPILVREGKNQEDRIGSEMNIVLLSMWQSTGGNDG